MSQENAEVVRAYNGPYEGENLVPRVKEGIGRVGLDPQPDAVLALSGRKILPSGICIPISNGM